MVTISRWLDKFEEVLDSHLILFGIVLAIGLFNFPVIFIGLILTYLVTRIIF